MTDNINIKINQKNIESFIDGYKITIQFVQTIKVDENKFLTLQQENISFLMESGDAYSLNFASTLSDFDESVIKFRKSADTFAAGEIKFSYPSEAKKVSNIVTKCGTGTIEKDGICVPDVSKTSTKESKGGCLIATATYGSELAPQVQFLREIRDNTVMSTTSGMAFMTGFNQFYYSFSPTIADWERENPTFKEFVKITLTPLISPLSILNYVDMDSESNVIGYGISLILLNVGTYFVAPAIIIIGIRKKL